MYMPGPHNKTLHPALVDGPITALASGAATLTLDLDDLPDMPRWPHLQASVEFYSDAAGTVEQPGAGTRVITAEVLGAAGVDQPITNGGSLDFSTDDNAPAYWTANTVSIKAVMASITTATHCRLRIAANGV